MLASKHVTASTWSTRHGARSCVGEPRSLALCAVALALSLGVARAQGDTWLGPWDWECQVAPGVLEENKEFSHAALIPQGPYRGMVLMWRSPRNPPPAPPQSNAWLFNPTQPTILFKIDQDLASDIFCSAMSWDKDGQLVVAGGAPGGSSAPEEAYRFHPSLMQLPPQYPQTSCNPGGVDGAPWRNAGQMSIGRYYPTLITLFKGDILGTPVLGGASSFVLGGLASFAGQVAFGNDYWQLLEHASLTWSRTFHSPTEKFTNPPLGGVKEQYELKKVAGLQDPYPYFENYPRVFQLTTLGTSPEFIKALFAANDVWPDNSTPASPAGHSWVIHPRYANNPSVWQLWTAHNAGTTGANPSIDRHFGSAVLLHTLQGTLDSNGKNRVLVFGGLQKESGSLRVNGTVQEFRPGDDPTDPNLLPPGKPGLWVQKATGLNFPRHQANAVVLPTGEILIVGGLKECPCDENYLMPEHRPELYRPGDAGQSTGAARRCSPQATPLGPASSLMPGPTTKWRSCCPTDGYSTREVPSIRPWSL